jgi:hypothetical protein
MCRDFRVAAQPGGGSRQAMRILGPLPPRGRRHRQHRRPFNVPCNMCRSPGLINHVESIVDRPISVPEKQIGVCPIADSIAACSIQQHPIAMPVESRENRPNG